MQLNQPQTTELQMQIRLTNQYSKKLITLDKIYKNDDKFDGMDDKFNSKVTIFFDKCRQVDLLASNYIQDVFIILLS